MTCLLIKFFRVSSDFCPLNLCLNYTFYHQNGSAKQRNLKDTIILRSPYITLPLMGKESFLTHQRYL